MNIIPHLLSSGDFIDLYYKVKERGLVFIFKKFKFKTISRTATKWNTIVPGSDWWVIPEVRRRWNEKCTGNPALEYEDYVVDKYLKDKSGLKMLSVGCGSGSRERKFGKYINFKYIQGIDIAVKQIEEARKISCQSGFINIQYDVIDFSSYTFRDQSFDLILFNSSLHHLNHVDWLITNKVLPLLKDNGLLVILEHVGPNRLQWTSGQLAKCNELLKTLPPAYKMRTDNKNQKKKVYRPGLLRMMLVDPSEAIDSESILPSIHSNFSVLEEKKVGGNLLHLLLKDISHNFLETDAETQSLLKKLFDEEDLFIANTEKSDMVFGIYAKI